MKILVKLPSRGRPEQMISVLSKAIAKANNNGRIHYQLTLDNDDKTTNNQNFDQTIDALRKHAEIRVIRGNSSGKIHAVNRDMSMAPDEWDILVLLSDDMVCQQKGWDDILRSEMEEKYPDTDGVLWFNDGYTGEKLNTMCILGSKYFERFGYIYHPSYKSLWCDNEFMDVANQLEKQTYNPMVLFKHEHPANNGNVTHDHVYAINDRYYREDEKTYRLRKSRNFDL